MIDIDHINSLEAISALPMFSIYKKPFGIKAKPALQYYYGNGFFIYYSNAANKIQCHTLSHQCNAVVNIAIVLKYQPSNKRIELSRNLKPVKFILSKGHYISDEGKRNLPKDCHVLMLKFDEEYLKQFEQRFGGLYTILMTDNVESKFIDCSRILSASVKRFLNFAVMGIGKRIRIKDWISETLIEAVSLLHPVEQMPCLKLDSKDIYNLEKAKQIILSGKRVTIFELSAKLSLNTSKLKYGFKFLFGESIFRLFQDNRLQQARDELKHSRKPMKEISVKAGYTQQATFIAAFRRQFGYTPGYLRKNKSILN